MSTSIRELAPPSTPRQSDDSVHLWALTQRRNTPKVFEPLHWSVSSTGSISPFVSLIHGAIDFEKHVTGFDALLGTVLGFEEPVLFGESFSVISELEAQFARLEELAQLGSGWDGEEGLSPTPIALRAAATMIMEVAMTTLRAPIFIAPLPDGSLQIEWTDQKKRFELMIETDGSLSADLLTGLDTSHMSFQSLEDIDVSEVVRIISDFKS